VAGADNERKDKNLLFLKKKKQKDFFPSGPCLGIAERKTQTGRSFLVLFFKREHSSSLPALPPWS
jgi:hypothetical protein